MYTWILRIFPSLAHLLISTHLNFIKKKKNTYTSKIESKVEAYVFIDDSYKTEW